MTEDEKKALGERLAKMTEPQLFEFMRTDAYGPTAAAAIAVNLRLARHQSLAGCCLHITDRITHATGSYAKRTRDTLKDLKSLAVEADSGPRPMPDALVDRFLTTITALIPRVPARADKEKVVHFCRQAGLLAKKLALFDEIARGVPA